MVPKLRFKEFCGEWEEKKAENLCKIHTGKSNTQDKVENGIYPFFVRSPIIERSNKYLYDCEAVLTVGDGVGTGKVYHYINGKFDFHQRVYVMRNFKDIIGRYFYYYFSNNFYKRVQKMSAKNSVDSVRMDMISKMNIALPSLSEQTKIADFLSTVDDKIQNQQDKINHLENIKKGFMQKIFYRKIRFKDDGGEEFPEWEEKRLYNILKEGSKEKVKDTSQYRKITVRLNLKGINFSDLKRDMVDKRPFYVRYKNEIIIGKQNYFNGSIAIVDEKFDGCICSNAIMSFKVIKENLKFVYWYLSQSSYISKNAYLANGTGQKELTEKDFLNMKIDIPCLKEQQKIAGFLSSFDQKISTEKETLEHLKQLKKGLLQQMFV